MAGLILKLRPREQLLINGVIVENGDQKARLRICSDGAHILRLRDAIKPEEAKTPLTRAYYIAQLAVAGLISNDVAAGMLHDVLGDLGGAEGEKTRQEVEKRSSSRDFYQLMRFLGAKVSNERARADRANGACKVGGAPDADRPRARAVGARR